ncbi:MAG: hypothetical protein KKB70_02605 [Proteobacteria bacterium]|nr:hypothetical protein [Pseudomonadota bacterium]
MQKSFGQNWRFEIAAFRGLGFFYVSQFMFCSMALDAPGRTGLIWPFFGFPALCYAFYWLYKKVVGKQLQSFEEREKGQQNQIPKTIALDLEIPSFTSEDYREALLSMLRSVASFHGSRLDESRPASEVE